MASNEVDETKSIKLFKTVLLGIAHFCNVSKVGFLYFKIYKLHVILTSFLREPPILLYMPLFLSLQRFTKSAQAQSVSCLCHKTLGAWLCHCCWEVISNILWICILMTKNLPKGVHLNNPYWTFLFMLASLSLLLPLYPALFSIYFLFLMEFFSGMLHQMLWASKYW